MMRYIALVVALLVSFIACPTFAQKKTPSNQKLTAKQVFDKCKDAIVQIKTDTGTGTGFLVGDPKQSVAFVITCYHVVSGAKSLKVLTNNGKGIVIKKIAVNRDGDAALIVVEPLRGVRPLESVSTNDLSPGDDIFVIGNPLGFLTQTITTGILSSKRQVGDRKYLQITAPVSHGSSGSPILNSYGQAVGFVSFNFKEGQSLNMGLALSEVFTAQNNGFRTPGQFYADNGNVDNVAVKAPDSPETPAAEVPSPITTVAVTGVLSLSAPRTLAEYKAQMASIPGGSFLMGSDNGVADEKPVHSVTMSPFQMGRTPVTVAMWKEYCRATGEVMPDRPSWGWIDDHPMVNVSWQEAKAYCDWANLQLPTEAQWEYAAKGGKNTEYPWGDAFDESKVVWYKNSGNRTAPVYRRARVFVNAFGLVDMGGNVRQWCADWYAKSYYEYSPERDPHGPSSGDYRVLRGGSWLQSLPVVFRAAVRDWLNPSYSFDFNGFRAVSSGLR